MVEPRHKVREVKTKTVVDRLKSSAIFILFVIVVIIVTTTSFIFWLSRLLSSGLQGMEIIQHVSFYMFVGLSAALALFFFWARMVQKRAHG